jgi:hypothetical protein
MITALSPRPCHRLSTNSVRAPSRPLFWPLRNVNSLLPSAVFRHFWDRPFGRDAIRETKHQARPPGRPILKGASRRNKKFTVTFGGFPAFLARFTLRLMRFAITPEHFRKRLLILGWGGRIRTYEWRHQKPLPYHLATPHLGGEGAL